MLATVAEKTIDPILFELDCEAARQAQLFEWVVEHGFNTNQPFRVEDDVLFGQEDTPNKPSFFEPFSSYDYAEVAERAVHYNDTQMQSGYYLWRFFVTPAKF